MITKETIWLTWIGIRHATPTLPRLLHVCHETQTLPSYKHLGQYRQSENHYLFKITLSGEGFFLDASGNHPVPAGSGFLCRVSDPATGYRYPPKATAPWSFLYMLFDGADALVQTLLQRFGSVYSVPPDIIHRLQRFQCSGEATLVLSAMESARFVYDILTSLGEFAEHESPTPLTASERLRQMSQLILSEAQRPLSVQELASQLGISREYLARLTRKELGLTPYEWIEQCRLRDACVALKETRLEIKEIAARFGYSTPSHFSRAFIRKMGMPPTRFRDVGSIPLGIHSHVGDARSILGPNVSIP